MLNDDNQLEFEKVVSKIGFPLAFEDYRATYKYNANIEKISEFEDKLEMYIGNDYNAVLQTIKEYKDIFDTELYIFHIGKYLDKDYKASKEAEILKTKYYPHIYYTSNYVRPTNTSLNYCNNLLKNIDVVDLGVNLKTGKLVIESSQELYGDKDLIKNSYNKNLSKFEEIKNKIGLENVLKYLDLENLIDFCKYDNLGSFLFRKLKLETSKNDEKYFEKYEQVIFEYLEYMDLDKMLIFANYFYYSKYNMTEGYTEEDINKLLEYTQNVEQIIDNKYDTFVFKTKKTLISFQSVKSSINTLKKCFINGTFFTIDQIKEISQKLLNGEISIKTINKDIFKNSLSFTNDEYIMLLKNDNNFEYILENELLSKDEILDIYEDLKKISNSELNRLYEFNIINNEYLLKKYMSDDINIEVIKNIRDNTNKQNELEKIVSNFELITLFLDENKEDDFYKYQLLYKTLLLDNKNEEEKNNLGIELIGQIKELLDVTKIKNLYDLGLITREVFIDSINIFSLFDLFIDGKLNSNELRDLYNLGLISENILKEYLLNKNIQNDKKIVLVYGMFPNENDINYRKNLLKEVLDFNYSSIEDENAPIYNHQFIIEQNNIWTVVSKYDSSFRQSILNNGYIIFYLPNKNLYIIEQVFYNQRIVYGSASFVITDIEFDKNKDLLILDNTINKIYLNSLYINNKADKLVSTGWVNSLNRYLENM